MDLLLNSPLSSLSDFWVFHKFLIFRHTLSLLLARMLPLSVSPLPHSGSLTADKAALGGSEWSDNPGVSSCDANTTCPSVLSVGCHSSFDDK